MQRACPVTPDNCTLCSTESYHTSVGMALGPHRHDGQRTRLSGRKQLRMFVPQAPVCPDLAELT